MKTLNTPVLLVLGAFLLHGSFSLAGSSESSAPQSLYKSQCAMCHGADGTGKTFMGKKLNIVDLRSSAVQNKTAAELSAIIEKGKDKMPAFDKKLSQEKIKDLAVYVRELSKKDPQ